MCRAEALAPGDLGLDPRLLGPSRQFDQGFCLLVWGFMWLFVFDV